MLDLFPIPCSYRDHFLFFLLGEKFLKFYWFDAYEDRFKQPGRVGQGCLTVELLRKSLGSLYVLNVLLIILYPTGTIYLFGKVWIEAAKAYVR